MSADTPRAHVLVINETQAILDVMRERLEEPDRTRSGGDFVGSARGVRWSESINQ